MTERNPASWLQLRTDHTAENDRLTAFGRVATAGIYASVDLAVTANSTPNMTVKVAAGNAMVANDGGTNRGMYGVFNDGVVTINISASHPTLARKDLIVATVRDAQYAGGNSDWLLQVVTGSPASSPADPAMPANSLVLARVNVGANVSQINAGNIDDLRVNSQLERTSFQERVTVIPLAATDGVRVMRFSDITAFQHRFDGNGDAWLGREKGTVTVGPDTPANGVIAGIASAAMRPVGASSRTTFTISSTSYVFGAGNELGVTIIAPPSGQITIHYYFIVEGSTTGERVYGTAEVRVNNTGGAVQDAANDNSSVQGDGTVRKTITGFHNVSGLSPGQQYYVVLAHRVKDGASNSNIIARRINVVPAA